MKGNKTCVMVKPPIIKKIVATRDGHWRLAIPIMEWPEVHPPAYLVPKPTRNPPTTKKISPVRVNKFSHPKISTGIKESN